jgi:type VI secretion system protein ImpB
MPAATMAPRSRITLTYDTRQPDQPRTEKELPLRLLVMGDLTGRAWKADGAAAADGELDSRPIHNLNGRNLDAVMAKLAIAVELQGIADHVSAGGVPFNATIPITSMASFEPGQVVQHVAPARRLLELRKLVLELQAQVDNNKKLRKLVRDLTSPAQAPLLAELRSELGKLLGSELRVPSRAELEGANGALPAPTPPLIAGPTTPPAPTTPTTPTTTPTTPSAPTTPTTPTTPPAGGS